MKIFGTFLVVLLSCGMLLLHCAQTNTKSHKIYISQRDIRINKEKILIRTKQRICEAKSLHRDQKGLFVLNKELIRLKGKNTDHDEGYGKMGLECSRCGKKFSTFNDCSAHIWRKHGGWGVAHKL
jgi:uncharacterized C2H2 Zn-finger protein